MTKYEWESELKKNIHRLPDEEVSRVMEYYGELFEDKIESGLKEHDIIAEFGNPVDVADKILTGFDGELKPESRVQLTIVPPDFSAQRTEPAKNADNWDPSKKQEQPNFGKPQPRPADAAPVPQTNIPQMNTQPQNNAKTGESGGIHGGRMVVFIILCVLLGGAFAGVAIGLWAVVISLGAAGVACSVGGVAGFVPSAIMLFDSVPVALVQFACCVACIGIGILLIILTVKFCIIGFKATRGLFRAIKNWLSRKKVRYEN